MSTVKELMTAMKTASTEKTKGYDTTATVKRIEGNTAWVHIPGGVDETPVRMTINANVDDVVQVRVSGGTAFLVGNGTRPPTDDSTANHAVNIANTVQNDITVLNTVVAENIEATNAKFTTVEADTAKIHNLTADQLTATVGYIGDLTAEHIAADDIIADHATIGSLDVNYASIGDLEAATGRIDDLEANEVVVNDTLKATNASIEYLESDWISTDRLVLTGNNKNNYPPVQITEAEFNVNKTAYWTKSGDTYTQCTSSSVYDPDEQYYVRQTVKSIIEAINTANNTDPQVIISNDKLIAASMDVAELSAITADMGTLTAGKIQKGNNFINLNTSPASMEFKNASTWANATQGLQFDTQGNLNIKGKVTITSGSNVPTTTEMNNAIGNAVDNVRPFIKGTQTAATGTWTGVCSELTEITEGQEILYFLPYAGSGNATLNLTLGNGSTTGAVNCYYQNASRLTTHFGAGMTIPLVYHKNFNVGGTNYTGWWTLSQYNTNDVDRKRINNAVKVAENITQYCVAGRSGDGHKKLVSGLVIDLAYPICYLYQANISGQTYAVASGGTTNNFYTAIPSINLRNTKDSWTGTQYAMCYIKGTMSGNNFTVHSDIFTTAVPTSDDGFAYIPIGLLYSTYQVNFSCDNSIYGYKNGSFGPLANREASAAQATANAAAPKSSAVAEEQYIYISKASGTTSVSGTTTWVTEAGDKQNTWSTKRPTYNSSYPVLFVAKQKKVVSGTVTCTTPVKDDTTTIIDGGHITTGTIDSNRLNADTIKVNAANIQGNLTIGKVDGLQNELNGKQAAGDYATKTQAQGYAASEVNAARSWYATCSTAAGTAAKVATISPATTAFTTSILKAGTLVNVKFTVTNTAAVADLTLNVNSTGAKHIKTLRYGAINNIAGTGYLAANTTYQFTYDGTYWVMQENYNADTINRTRWQNVIAAAEAITNGHIICGTASGYRDIGANISFDMAYPLLYAGTAIAKGATTGTRDNNFLQINGVNASSNGTITSGAANKVLYLKGTLTGNTFKIAASPFMTTVVPTTADGLCYIPLGIMYSATNIYFDSTDQLYAYKDGAFGPVSLREASGAAKTATNYITNIDSSGIWVTPSGKKPTNTSTGAGATGARINASGMQIFKAGVSIAEYGDSARVGKEASGHTDISSAGMTVYGSDGTVELANIGYGNGKNSSGGTSSAPYFSFGKRKSGTIGNHSTVTGYENIASGYTSSAEGQLTEAAGTNSHSMGFGTIANGDNQLVIGRANVADTTSPFIIGKGTYTTNPKTGAVTFTRKNALWVDSQGALFCNGYKSDKLTVSGSTHAIALQNWFNSDKSSIARNVLHAVYSSAYGNGSMCMGYYISGYDSGPYGGFFVAHYADAKYVGIVDGSYFEYSITKTLVSSRKAKENIKLMAKEEAEKLYNIDVVSFDYKKNYENGRKSQFGVIAEDCDKEIPYVVSKTDNGEDAVWGIDYIKFIPYLIKVVQEQHKEITQLRKEVNDLNEKLNALANIVDSISKEKSETTE